MAYSLISSVSAGAAASGDTFTSGALDSTGANLLVVFISAYDGSSIPILTDSKTNAWQLLTVKDNNDGGPTSRLYYVASPIVGSGHTFTLTGNDRYGSVGALAFSGAKAASPFDVENSSAPGAVATIQPGSVSPSEDNELIVCGLGVDTGAGTETIGSSFTKILDVNFVTGEHYGLALAYKIQTTAGAENPMWTINGTVKATCHIATFKAEPGGGGGVIKQAASYYANING